MKLPTHYKHTRLAYAMMQYEFPVFPVSASVGIEGGGSSNSFRMSIVVHVSGGGEWL